MRIAASLLFLSFGAAAAASAQNVTPCNGSTSSYGTHVLYYEPHKDDTALTYTATIKQSFEQKLADGNVIRTSQESVEARDADGRTLRKVATGCWPGADGAPQMRVQFSLTDGKTRAFSFWDVGPGSYGLINVSSNAVLPNWNEVTHVPYPSMHKDSKKEDLGERTIAGMTATGIRTTETIAAHEVGNEMPIDVTHETWETKEPHLVLLSIDDDPRSGKRTWEVMSFVKGDPDPAMFVAPASYKVEEMTRQIASGSTHADASAGR